MRSIKILFKKFFTGQPRIFRAARLLKLADINKFHVCSHMYKTIRLQNSHTVRNSIDIVSPSHTHDTRNRNIIILPFPRIDAFKMSYKYSFINIYLLKFVDKTLFHFLEKKSLITT